MTPERYTLLFPAWTLLGAILSLVVPEWFTWFRGPWITIGLGVIMLGMGLGLAPRDFVRVGRRPAPVGLGVLTQFLVMPSLAALLALVLQLEAPLAVGLILVGCCRSSHLVSQHKMLCTDSFAPRCEGMPKCQHYQHVVASST